MTPSGQGDLAIQMTDLCTAFGSQKVLDGVTLTVAHGETLVVLGRSGTGKSVLLRHLIGLQLPDSGSVRVLGEEITTLAEQPLNAMRRKVGFVFQNAALYDSLSVVENVEFPLGHHTDLTPAQRRERAMEILGRVGMDGAAAIQVFAGRKGDHDENLILTQAQAMVVRAYLAERFELDDAKVKTMGMGKTEAEPAQDSRIVISVYPSPL